MGIKKIAKSIGKGMLTPLKWVKNVIEIIAEKPIVIGVLLLILIGFFVVNTTLKRGESYEGDHLDNILIEAHGLLFDVFVFGVLIIIFNRIGERKRDIRRYLEEIDDYRGWDEKEATYRIVGNIKRLNKRGVTEIDLSGCYLVSAKLGMDPQFRVDIAESRQTISDLAKRKEGYLVITKYAKRMDWIANLQGAKLVKAKLQYSSLISVDLRKANLYSANLQGAYLYHAQLQESNLRKSDFQNAFFGTANFKGANLIETNLQNARYLTAEHLSEVKTLYKAKLDPDLEKEIKEKYPHLLEKPKYEWEE